MGQVLRFDLPNVAERDSLSTVPTIRLANATTASDTRIDRAWSQELRPEQIEANRRQAERICTDAYQSVFSLVRLVNMQTTLILAAIYNIIGGVTILFLFRLIAPLIHLNDFGPGLFRMFVGGTAVLFGAAYIAVWRDYRRNRPFLVYGTVLKYWAFAISLFGFLTSSLSLQVLLLFGIGNLIFAALFTHYLLWPQAGR